MSGRIILEAVGSESMREPYRSGGGVGDWFFDDNGDLKIQVVSNGSSIVNNDQAFLIALHELVEAKLCFKAGITDEVVTEFDSKSLLDDPGSDLKAPYWLQHRCALIVEYMVATWLGLYGYDSPEALV